MAQANGQRPRRMDRMILALLENGTLEKAAASLGISIATLWRWTQKEEFQEALLKARREAFHLRLDSLKCGSGPGIGHMAVGPGHVLPRRRPAGIEKGGLG